MAKRSDYDYIFSSVLIRSKETKLLKKGDFERLAEQKDLGAVLRLLEEFGYSGAAESVDNAEAKGGSENVLGENGAAKSFENILDDALEEAYRLVVSLLGDEPQIGLLLCPNDYHNAKAVLKAEFLGIEPEAFLTSNASIPPQRLLECIRKRDFALLSSEMKHGILDAHEAFSKIGDPQEIDIILDKACFADMHKQAGELENTFVSEYVRLLTDSANMSAFVRLRQIGRPKSFFTKVFCEGGNLDLRFFESSYEESFVQIADRVQPYGYYDVFAVGAKNAAETGSYILLERTLDDLKMKLAKTVKYKPFALETAVAYIIAKEAEIKNIRIISAGKQANTAEDMIAERLRETYV